MAQREASGDFDYLVDDEADAADAADSDADYFDPAKAPGRDMTFDAFDENTWYFEPAPSPWYRTKHTLGVLIAAAIAVIALVVSGVLLLFRAPDQPAAPDHEPVRPSVQTTAPARTPAPTRQSPPPGPTAPPRVETSAPPAPPPPPATYRPRNPPTRAGREPEIGVTRTPVTRSPISVAPQRPGQSQR